MDSRTDEKVTVMVAAKALKVSVKTIQRWIKSGKIQSIREDNRVFIPVDEIRARLQEKADVLDIDQDKKEDVRTIKGQSEDKNPDVIPIERTHYEGLLTRLGQLEAKQELLIEYKTNMENKDRLIADQQTEIDRLRTELERARVPWWRKILGRY